MTRSRWGFRRIIISLEYVEPASNLSVGRHYCTFLVLLALNSATLFANEDRRRRLVADRRRLMPEVNAIIAPGGSSQTERWLRKLWREVCSNPTDSPCPFSAAF